MPSKSNVTALDDFYCAKGREEYRAAIVEWLGKVAEQIEAEPLAGEPGCAAENPMTAEEKRGALSVVLILKEKVEVSE